MTPEAAGSGRIEQRRLERLRDEMLDEQVPVPIDGPGGEALLEEIGFARRPPVHEGRPPRYGVIVAVTSGGRKPDTVTTIPTDGRDLDELRPSADGRSSFVVRGLGGWLALVGVAHTVEHEADLVRFRPAGTVLVQRTAGGLVRICTEDGIVTWDSMSWRFKPGATPLAEQIGPLVPDVDRDVLDAVLDLGVHWLSAGRVGATVVWDQGHGPLDRLDLGSTVAAPALTLTDRSHRSSWLSLLAQMDRGVVIDADGALIDVGVTLTPSADAAALVPPLGGTRHTSARRFSFDHDTAVVMVVSEDGPVSIFRGGAELAASGADLCRAGGADDVRVRAARDETTRRHRCTNCGRTLRVAVADFPAWSGGPDAVDCPVCDHPFDVDAYRARVLATVPGR